MKKNIKNLVVVVSGVLIFGLSNSYAKSCSLSKVVPQLATVISEITSNLQSLNFFCSMPDKPSQNIVTFCSKDLQGKKNELEPILFDLQKIVSTVQTPEDASCKALTKVIKKLKVLSKDIKAYYGL